MQAAREAAQQVRIPVHIIDSGTASMSLGYAAVSAARVAGAGGQLARVLEAAERRVRAATELIYVDTLEFLRRTGRVGAAQSLVGTAFSIKPLLTVRNGEVSPLARVRHETRDEPARRPRGEGCGRPARGRRRDSLRLGRDRGRATPEGPDSRITDVVVGDASTVIGAHVGPGALSITVSPT